MSSQMYHADIPRYLEVTRVISVPEGDTWLRQDKDGKWFFVIGGGPEEKLVKLPEEFDPVEVVKLSPSSDYLIVDRDHFKVRQLCLLPREGAGLYNDDIDKWSLLPEIEVNQMPLG
jgi:hypothetical protein